MYVEGTALIDLATNSCSKPQQPSTVLVVPCASVSGTANGTELEPHDPTTDRAEVVSKGNLYRYSSGAGFAWRALASPIRSNHKTQHHETPFSLIRSFARLTNESASAWENRPVPYKRRLNDIFNG